MGTWTLWVAFNAGVALLLLLDLGLFHRRAHAISLREAAVESFIWVALSVAFGFWIFSSHGRGPGLEFFTGYVIEKSLSVDNVFIFLLIFQFFRVDSRYQHRLLFWGVLGALVMRGAMIGVGAVLIQKFTWILYLFGAFLLWSGVQLLVKKDEAPHPERNPMIRLVQRLLPVDAAERGPRFLVRRGGRWHATPLLIVLAVVETTDLVFALDSIPAIFAVTRDPFIIYTSNVMAILGLRAMYFLLAAMMTQFRFLRHGLSLVLVLVGLRMLVDRWVDVPTGLTLSIVCGILAAAVAASVLFRPRAGGVAGD